MEDEKNLNPQEETNLEDKKEDIKAEEAPQEEVKEEPAIDTVAQDVAANQEEQAPTTDAPTIIDNTAEAPIQPIQDLPRTAKLKEPMSKKKKITIIVISIVAFIALFSVIFFPVYFCYVVGRIHVYDASDFVPEDGKRFVLEKDIVYEGDLNLLGSSCSIDLNGHDLQVTGTLSIGKNDALIQVGTLKKDSYTAKGNLSCGVLDINSELSDVNIATSFDANEVKVNAKNVTFTNATIREKAAFTAQSIKLNGTMTTNDATAFDFTNCANVELYATLNPQNITATASNIQMFTDAKVNNITLDATSTLVSYGEVKSITGGDKVAMLKGSSCPSFEGVNILALYNAFEKKFTAKNITKTVYLETLPAPVDFYVSDENGKFTAKCTPVDAFDGIRYKFIVDDGEPIILQTNEYDITDYLRNKGAASHRLQAYVLGNYSFDTLADLAEDGKTLYLDSENANVISYIYTLKLTTPKNLSAYEEELESCLAFDKVEFADYYLATIDKETKVAIAENKASFEANHPGIAAYVVEYSKVSDSRYKAILTEQLKGLGYHSIRLVACSFVNEIETSKEAMTSYKTTKKIDLIPEDVSATSELIDGVYVNTITINCEEAKMIILNIDDEQIRITAQDGLATYTFTSSDISYVGKTFTIQAEAYEFYKASDVKVITFTAD